MCDYSLHGYPNRLAVEGEDLIAYRFGGVSLGLASPADVGGYIAPTHCGAAPPKFWSRAGSRSVLERNGPDGEAHPAVCVPPGARLLLRDSPKRAQRELGVSGSEVVTFVETTAEVNTYRDAIQFKNGRRMLLQVLRDGQRATVLSLGRTEGDRVVHSAGIRIEELARY